jgi:hypothetical protein
MSEQDTMIKKIPYGNYFININLKNFFVCRE